MFRIALPNELRVNIRRFMKRTRLLQFALVGAIAVLFCSCEELPQQIQQPLAAIMPTPTPAPGWWNDEGAHGEPRIVVHIGDQRAYFYKGKRLVGEATVSTGKAGFSTPPGHYTVLTKDRHHVSTVFGDYVDEAGNIVVTNIDSRKDRKPRGTHFDGARMPYAMFFRGGYAMHQGYVPPFAASHGCIRVPEGMAERFYNNASVGTPVSVKE
jgi:lipoprotein-anchoring transpeptidase ErfK/SrfK